MQNLFKEFNPVSKQEWLSKIEKDAKGKLVESFDWQLTEDFVISPFAHLEDPSVINSPIQTKLNNNWSITERISISAPTNANKDILDALENGASALMVQVDEELSQTLFNQIFNRVNFTYIKIFFECKDISIAEQTLKSLVEFCRINSMDASEVYGSFSLENQLVNVGATLLPKYKDILKNFSFAYAIADPLYAYPETVIEEIASLTNGLRVILDTGEKHNTIDLNISVSKSYFVNIAKIRAMHIIAKNICKAYEQSPSLNLNAGISSNFITEDENQNLIQFTSQAMSAVIGGVSCLMLPATDIKSNGGSDARRRLSRNIQSIMQMESYMDKVADPAAGSYYIDSLTQKIASKSWSYLQAHS